MKRLLIPIVLSQMLLADCTLQEEDKANRLWKESRNMQYGEKKFTKIKEALGICSMKKIEIDAYIYIINKNLNSTDLSLEKLNDIEEKITEVRSMNNNLLTNVNVNFKDNNSKILNQLNEKLVDLKIKFETNKKKLSVLNSFKDLSVEDIKKEAKRGESISIIINFSNNISSVKESQNINNLAKAIYEILKEDSNSEFTITGYASSKGEHTYNQKLSEKRAYNVSRYIQKKYQNTNGHIKTYGKGESVLICNNGYSEDSDGDGEYVCIGGTENESSSRRVEIIKY